MEEANQAKCLVFFRLHAKEGLWNEKQTSFGRFPNFSEVDDRGNVVGQNREYQDKGNDVTHQ